MSSSDKKAMIKWYDDYASDTELCDDQVVSVSSARYRLIAEEIRQLVSMMRFLRADVVLDAGCGAGRFLTRIARTVDCRLVGIDTSVNMVKRTRRRLPNADCLIADALYTPFRASTFTAILCYSVLWHIVSERDNRFINTDIYETGLEELNRVLRLGGRILFNISNPFHPQSIIDFVIGTVSHRFLRRGKLQTYCIPLVAVKSILSKLGLRILDIRAQGYYPLVVEAFYGLFNHSPSDKLVGSYYNSFKRLEDSVVGKKLLSAFAHSFAITARRVKRARPP